MPCQLSAFFSLPLEKYLAVEHLSFPYENEAASRRRADMTRTCANVR
jgi:hypothetical protein